MDKETRLKKYRESSEEVKNLYSDIDLGNKMYDLYIAQNLPPARYPEFADVIGDVILGFTKIQSVPHTLLATFSLPLSQGQSIVNDLIESLSSVLISTDTETAPTPNTTETNVQQETRPNPIHTMEDDVDKIHGYGSYRAQYPSEGQGESETATSGNSPTATGATVGSSQDDLLRRNAEVPKYE